jgi:CARDB protein
MRRALMSLLLFLAFPAAADAASVKVVDCVPALDPAARTTTFEARMRPARGSERMQVRFTLQMREDGLHLWRRVAAEGFDSWLSSLAGVRRYSYAKTVVNLAAPASYRTVVRFRWLDADGAVVKSARITSASCRQPDMRPNLVARRVDVLPGPDADTRRYAVTLRNDGRADAGPFTALLDVPDVELAPLSVLDLPASTQRVVTFTAPPCTAGAPLTVTLDPDQTVDERDEDDNVLVVPCPAP